MSDLVDLAVAGTPPVAGAGTAPCVAGAGTAPSVAGAGTDPSVAGAAPPLRDSQQN